LYFCFVGIACYVMYLRVTTYAPLRC
jgi:hypothetical protein